MIKASTYLIPSSPACPAYPPAGGGAWAAGITFCSPACLTATPAGVGGQAKSNQKALGVAEVLILNNYFINIGAASPYAGSRLEGGMLQGSPLPELLARRIRPLAEERGPPPPNPRQLK